MRLPIIFAATIAATTAVSAQTIDRKVLGCVAHAVYGESRDEPTRGQFAVAWSIIFRATAGLREHGGQDICDVAYKRSSTVWQYDGAKVRINDKRAWDKSLDVAHLALLGRGRPDMPVMYFCSTQVAGACRWHDRATKFVRQIGSHRFYTDRRYPTLIAANAQ